jgi:hypothetical protein
VLGCFEQIQNYPLRHEAGEYFVEAARPFGNQGKSATVLCFVKVIVFVERDFLVD